MSLKCLGGGGGEQQGKMQGNIYLFCVLPCAVGWRDGRVRSLQGCALLSLHSFLWRKSLFSGELLSVRDMKGKDWLNGSCQLSFSDQILQILTGKHQQESWMKKQSCWKGIRRIKPLAFIQSLWYLLIKPGLHPVWHWTKYSLRDIFLVFHVLLKAPQHIRLWHQISQVSWVAVGFNIQNATFWEDAKRTGFPRIRTTRTFEREFSFLWNVSCGPERGNNQHRNLPWSWNCFTFHITISRSLERNWGSKYFQTQALDTLKNPVFRKVLFTHFEYYSKSLGRLPKMGNKQALKPCPTENFQATCSMTFLWIRCILIVVFWMPRICFQGNMWNSTKNLVRAYWTLADLLEDRLHPSLTSDSATYRSQKDTKKCCKMI